MWLISERAQKKHHGRSAVRFLRKGLPMRRENRHMATRPEGVRTSIGVPLLWLALFATIFYVAFFSVFFHVGVPSISGMSEIPGETLARSVEREIAGKYLGIFSRRDFFLIRPERLEEHLLSEYPLLASASVTRVFPDGVRIEVTERKRIIVWCSGESVRNTERADAARGSCHLIDEEGKARASDRALLPENIPYVLFITDTSGKPVAIGEKVVDPDYGSFVVRMDELFPERTGMSLTPELSTASRFAHEVRVQTGEGWEIYLSSEIPIESSLNALGLLFEKELPQKKREQLAYIDLRVENRVYYAFRDGENMENPSDAESFVPEEKKTDAASKKQKK